MNSNDDVLETAARISLERAARVEFHVNALGALWGVLESMPNREVRAPGSPSLAVEIRKLGLRAGQEALTLVLLSGSAELQRSAASLFARSYVGRNVSVGHLLSYSGAFGGAFSEDESALKQSVVARYEAITGEVAPSERSAVRSERDRVEKGGSHWLRTLAHSTGARLLLELTGNFVREHAFLPGDETAALSEVERLRGVLAGAEAKAALTAVSHGHLKATTLGQVRTMALEWFDAEVPVSEDELTAKAREAFRKSFDNQLTVQTSSMMY